MASEERSRASVHFVWNFIEHALHSNDTRKYYLIIRSHYFLLQSSRMAERNQETLY